MEKTHEPYWDRTSDPLLKRHPLAQSHPISGHWKS